jgi:hypothetical protein
VTRSIPRLLLAALTLNGALLAGALAAPRVTFACSCDPTSNDDIGRFKGEPGVVVFVGTVRSVSPPEESLGRFLGELEVELVFKGDIPSSLMPVVGGRGGDCTLRLVPGQDMIAAALFDGIRITPALCMPFADPDSRRGEALIAAAEQAYGPGVPPPEGPPTDNDVPVPPGGEPERARVVLASVLGLAIGLFGAIAVLSRRRPGAG